MECKAWPKGLPLVIKYILLALYVNKKQSVDDTCTSYMRKKLTERSDLESILVMLLLLRLLTANGRIMRANLTKYP